MNKFGCHSMDNEKSEEIATYFAENPWTPTIKDSDVSFCVIWFHSKTLAHQVDVSTQITDTSKFECENFVDRMAMCKELINEIHADITFFNKIILCDESTFHLEE